MKAKDKKVGWWVGVCKEVELRHDSGGPFAPTYYMQGPENIFCLISRQ